MTQIKNNLVNFVKDKGEGQQQPVTLENKRESSMVINESAKAERPSRFQDFSNQRKPQIDRSLPDFLAQHNTKKFIEANSGEILYVKETGECFYQQSKTGNYVKIDNMR